MDELQLEFLEEAMALQMRVNDTYGKHPIIEAQVMLQKDTRAIKFLEQFNDTAQSDDVVVMSRQFLSLGFMLAADPAPHKTYLSAAMYFETTQPQDFSVTRETYDGAVVAIREQAEKIKREAPNAVRH